jgi:hypothetical protein
VNGKDLKEDKFFKNVVPRSGNLDKRGSLVPEGGEKSVGWEARGGLNAHRWRKIGWMGTERRSQFP